MAVSSSLPPPLPLLSIPKDYPDWVSSLVVKEIRQGLRGYIFVGGFMLLHLVLMMWAFTAAATATVSSGDAADYIFWIILLAGLFTLTVRMQGSVRGERRANTLELLQLTKQTPWRIATGKWAANMVLAALFLVSLLPYGMLRYFVGTFSLVSDALAIVCLFCATGVFSALYLFASCLPKGIGIVLNLALGLLAAGAVGIMIEALSGTGLRGAVSTAPTSTILGVVAGVIGFSFLYTLLFLFMAAGKVALGTEQIALRKRLVGWVIMLPACCAAIFGADKEITGMLLFACLPVLLVVLDAILTPTSAAVPAFYAFGRRGFPGRIAALFLSPSQGCGIVYALVTLLAFSLILASNMSGSSGEMVATILAAINSVFLPLALAQLFSGMLGRFPLYVRYWGFYACQWIFILACHVVSVSLSFTDLKLLACVSPAGVLMSASGMTWMAPTAFSAVHAIFILAVLGVFLVRDFSSVSRMLRGERSDLAGM